MLLTLCFWFIGIYVSRNTYIRAGVAEWKISNPVHIVCFPLFSAVLVPQKSFGFCFVEGFTFLLIMCSLIGTGLILEKKWHEYMANIKKPCTISHIKKLSQLYILLFIVLSNLASFVFCVASFLEIRSHLLQWKTLKVQVHKTSPHLRLFHIEVIKVLSQAD